VPEKQPRKKKRTSKNYRRKYMRKEYDLKKMKLKPNPYINKLKKSVTIRLDNDVIEYFKELSQKLDIPYQTLVNDFLRKCKENKLLPTTTWKKTI
jgi:uncharacterized protein (DUF4415 family)